MLIGFIFNYSWSRVRNFFISLAKVGFKNCEIVMFVKGLSADTIKKLNHLGLLYTQYLIILFLIKILYAIGGKYMPIF